MVFDLNVIASIYCNDYYFEGFAFSAIKMKIQKSRLK